MRQLGYALCVVICSLAVALAAPRRGPKAGKGRPVPAHKQVDPAVQAEIRKLHTEYSQHLDKNAYFAAVRVARKLYQLQAKATGADSAEAQLRKQMLAAALNLVNDYAGAAKLYRELVQTAEKQKGRESREVLTALGPLLAVAYAQMRYEDVEPVMQRMLALTKKLDGEKSQAYASQLTQYGSLLNMRNEYSAAMRVYEQALAVHEAIAASKHDASLIGPLQVVGSMYWQVGQHKKAIAAFDRAIAISETAKDVMLAIKISTVWSIATQYTFGGRKDLATPLFQKAIAMTEQEIARLEKTAPDDWQMPSLLNQLGYMYRYSNDFVKAERAYLKAIKLAEKKGTFSGMEAALADLKRLQGKHREALALLEKASATLAKYAPGSASAYNTLIVEVLRDLGEYKRAEKLLDEYRAGIVKKWGKKHATYGFAQMSAARVYALSGKLAQAQKALDEALDLAERDLSNVLRTGTDSDHATYFSRNGYVLDTAINFNITYAPTSASASRLALTTLLRRKGRILDAAAAALATIRSKLSPADKQLLDELNSARAQLAKLTVSGDVATGGANFAKEVAALEDKIQKLEAQVAKKSAAYRTVSQPIELAAIQKVIPRDARLVELVNYQPYDPKATYADMMAQRLPPRRYAAYIVGTKGNPMLVELGEAAPIDRAVEAFRKALADPDNDRAGELGKALYDLTMAKIIPKLGGATNILIAPDGTLNVVPFSALVDDNQQFLIKKYTFTYLTSGRDLLRLAVRTKAQGGGVLFADPKFDATGPAPAAGTTRGRRAAGLASFKWPRLPGTAAEADVVAKTFKGLRVFRGEQATEGALKSVKGPKILHLATHGFFLPDEKPALSTDPARGIAGVPMPSGGVLQPPVPTGGTYENPLLRSGLALAGANKLASGNEDGVLTALEASGLDLWGTKLVVLSACETGVGKVTNGDGVYGLRRSLVIAGAESLVMSLWQVDDFATKELMAGFYKKLAKGKPRSAALREIQLELLAKPKYAHPFYWASFLPAGATTPLKD